MVLLQKGVEIGSSVLEELHIRGVLLRYNRGIEYPIEPYYDYPVLYVYPIFNYIKIEIRTFFENHT